MSEMGQQETSRTLFYDLIGAGEQRRRKDNTEGLRTAGFPQYGWKVGISGGAFPTRRSV